MLAGKTNPTRCHSFLTPRARLRLASTYLFSSATLQLHCPKLNPVGNLPAVVDHGATLSRHQAAFSTVSQHSAPPFHNKRQRTFLKPRGKPKFRIRTNDEDDEVIKALREAEAQYAAYRAQYGGIEEEWSLPRSQDDLRLQQEQVFGSQSPPKTSAQGSDHENIGRSQSGLRKPSTPQRTRNARVSRSEASTADLEQELLYLARNDPHPTAIHNILRILISDRKTKPNTLHYEALILANTWPEYGSVNKVETILAEMEEAGVDIGANIITAVLKVLAIHPSIDLFHRMLGMVERRWVELSSETHHHLILAMIRTGQTELAAWTMDALRDKKKDRQTWQREVIPDYLIVLLIAELVKIGDWEGILRYMYKLRNRRAADRDVPVAFWGWLLEEASVAAVEVAQAAISTTSSSDATHETTNSSSTAQPATNLNLDLQIQLSNPANWLTEHIWTHYVASMSHKPSSTTAHTILHLASLTGTPWLAKSAIAFLTYMDGIDSQGIPRNKINEEAKQLVQIAEQRELENQKIEMAKQGKDWDVEMLRLKRESEEKAKIEKEDKEWWEKLMASFEREKRDGGRGNGNKDEHEHNKERTEMMKETTNIADNSNTTNSTTQRGNQFALFDFDAEPRGNLWPFFPTIGGMDSAYVDPWEALGPRSSSRRKWTEAQEHFKLVDRANKKKP